MSDAEEERKDKRPGEEESIPTASFAGSADGPGGQIGPYKLLSILGEGGFGMVYLAERQKPVKRRVALKVIKLGMDSKQVIARFEAERQALALLEHPNIAYVFNAGTTEAGRPYFVMEYVKGVSITEHCDREKLSIEERLGLFLQVCEAVQHAHQKGIIHRDIKPSNILVSIEGEKAVPKIIDFGVAKAISQPLTERTLFTEQGQLLGTPEYMSPEQAEMTAQDIDTRTDIYSLGVLLYELLTGALPFDPKTLRKEAFGEIQRIIREQEPPRPSTRLTRLGEEAESIAKSRRTEVATLARRLHKELEWIPLKAMRKERTHRYRSASELADDVQNYLNGAPLIAGPESAVYRISKFVRRNRALVTGIAAVLVVLVGGIVVSMIFAIGQARARAEAERQARLSQAVNAFLNQDVLASVDPAKAMGQEVTVRYVLDAATESIEGQFKGEPLIEASTRLTLGQTYHKLGEYKAAEPHLERALEIRREQLGEEDPDTLTSMNSLAVLYYEQGRWDEAEPLFVKTLEMQRRVLGEEHPATLDCMNDLALLYRDQKRREESEALFVKTLEITRHVLGEEHPDTLECMSNLALLYGDQKRFEESETLFGKTLEMQRRVLGEEHPDTLECMNNLALLYQKQGWSKEHEPLLVRTLEISRRVLGEEHPETLRSLQRLAWMYSSQARYDEAEPLQVKVLEGRRRMLGAEHPETLGSMRSLARLYRDQDRYDEAEPLFVKALEARRRVLGEEDPKTLTAMKDLAQLYRDQGRYDEAESLFVKRMEIRRHLLGEEDPKTLTAMKDLAQLYNRHGRYDEAESLFVKMLEIQRRVRGEEHPETLDSMNSLAWFYLNRGRPAEAEPLFVKVLETRRRLLGEEHPSTLNTMYELAFVYKGQGRYDEAEPLMVKALEIQRRVRGEEHQRTLASMVVLAQLYQEQGSYDEAELLFVKALEVSRRRWGEQSNYARWNIAQLSGLIKTLSSIGVEQYGAGAYEEALATLTRVEKLCQTTLNNESPPCDVAFIAMSLHQLGRDQEAQAALERLRCLFEDGKHAHEQSYLGEAEQLFAGESSKVYLVWECIEAGKLKEASRLVEELRTLPRQKDTDTAGRLQSAIKSLARAYYTRGKSVGRRSGGYREAIGDYEAAVRVDPGYARAFSDLGWLRAACPAAEFRESTNAIENATKACELTNWKDHRYVGTLAAVYAEVGDFATAVKWQKQAIDLLPEDKRAKWQANYESRLKLYQSGKPYRGGSLWSFSTGRMVSWWKFDKMDGNKVADSSGNGLNGKLVGGAKIITDPERGNVLSLDGDGDYVDCGNVSAFDITGSITVACWIKVNAFDKGWQTIVAKGDTAWRIAREEDKSSLQFACGPGRTKKIVRGTMGVKDGKWHHVAGVYDGTTIYLYVDGILDASVRTLGSIDTNNYNVWIGNNSQWGGRGWDGLIDDVRIYSYALTEAEIKAVYAGKGPSPGGKPYHESPSESR